MKWKISDVWSLACNVAGNVEQFLCVIKCWNIDMSQWLQSLHYIDQEKYGYDHWWSFPFFYVLELFISRSLLGFFPMFLFLFRFVTFQVIPGGTELKTKEPGIWRSVGLNYGYYEVLWTNVQNTGGQKKLI